MQPDTFIIQKSFIIENLKTQIIKTWLMMGSKKTNKIQIIN